MIQSPSADFDHSNLDELCIDMGNFECPCSELSALVRTPSLNRSRGDVSSPCHANIGVRDRFRDLLPVQFACTMSLTVGSYVKTYVTDPGYVSESWVPQ